MTRKLASAAACVVVAGLMAAAVPTVTQAADLKSCASSDEVSAFRLRDLQSRLMVAALSCNQQTAYNAFVQHFQPTLTSAGRNLSSYYQRTGGGEAALNRHLTEIANAAGLYRAQAPEQYCADTWAMFLLLEDEPEGLPSMAAKHILPSVAAPSPCSSAPDSNAPLTAHDGDEPSLLPIGAYKASAQN